MAALPRPSCTFLECYCTYLGALCLPLSVAQHWTQFPAWLVQSAWPVSQFGYMSVLPLSRLPCPSSPSQSVDLGSLEPPAYSSVANREWLDA